MDSNAASFYKHVAQTSPFPLGVEIKKAVGINIFDTSGKKYIDMISGISVANIGHSHPNVIRAIKHQLDKYMHVMAYGEFIQEPQSNLAAKLTGLLPEALNTVYFVNSGTEANEGALKLAKRITDRTEIIAFNGSYHGSTHGSLSVTGNPIKRTRFEPLLPGIKFIDFNNLNELGEINEKTASVIIEPIQGDAGVRIPSKEFIQTLRKRCSDAGVQLIFDEVQTGFGRTGKLFAFEHFDIEPDILTIAKAMGGGMPIGAFVSSKEKMDLFTHDPMLGHITTFGGHPVNCAAALANLEVLTENDLIKKVEEKGRLLEDLIRHPEILEIRRIGLMMAVEFRSKELVHKIVNNCLKNGIITFWFLSTVNSFRLAPPLIITDEELKEAADLIIRSIKESI